MNIKKVISCFKSKVFHNDVKKKESKKFQFLIPSKNAEKVEVYLSSLNEALDNDDVTNIAISGSYGAGKSSFIKTFESQNSQYNFLDISLATFKKEDKDLSLIEKSILQQIFYKVKQEKVPFSRFKRINRINHLKLKSFLVLISIFSLLVFFDSKYINSLEFIQFLNSESFALLNTPLLKLISLLILTSAGFFFIRSIIKSFTGITLDKLNLNNLEISTNKPDENSLLNKYLDEILYFFSEADYDVVVFQDLDRFDNIEIFTKLRELNNFINNSEQVSKKIVFLYAVKDEMFEEGDSRTKFFDFMIPIIPYVNSSTSYDKLLEFFENDLKEFDKKTRNDFKDFLRDISLYIKDMRLLKNIYNEYKIYDEKIGRKLDKVKLLAVMVYKNFYPEDFSLLHKDEGIVFNVFKNRNQYIKTVDNQFIQSIEELRNEIKKIENELINNVEELRKIYVFSLIKKLGNNPSQLRVGNKNINFSVATEDSNFELIKKSNNVSNPSYSYNSISFSEIEKEINELSYDEREKNILEKDTDRTQNLYNEIKDIEKKQKVLNSRTISELCVLENMNDIIGRDIEDKKGLLKFLILNGFIDENYYMFLSYSFNKSLTSTDTEFLKAVINNISVDFDFNLTNLNEIINKLRINEFKKNAILNFNLVGFLLENKTKFAKQYEALFRQLLNGSEKSLDFIFDYLKILPKHNTFIIEVVDKWKGFWEYIYNSDFTQEGKEELFYKVLTNNSVKNIIELNTNNTLKNHIENLSNIIELDENENSKLKELLKLLDIKFTSIKAPILNKEIFDYMYLNNHYTLNKSMIEQIIYKKYAVKEDIEEELTTNHLTTILLLDKDGKLIKRIEDNIEVYIKDIFLELKKNDSESEETIIKLLNNEFLNNELKKEIIKSQKLIIEEASKIKSGEILEILVQNNKIKTNWSNINTLYATNGFNKTLINYLNNISIAKTLSKTRINSKYCEKNKTFKTKILKDILESNEIDTASYKLLIKSNGYWYETFDICNLNQERIDLLLEYNILQVTRENIEKLIECSSSKHLVLIERHFNKFIDEYDSIYDLLTEEDYIKLLKSNKINIEQKFNLIRFIDIESFEINDEVASLLEKLYFKNRESMSIELFNKIIVNTPEKEKLNVFISHLEYNSFSSSEIANLLDTFSFPYNRLCMKIGSYETLPHTNENFRLLKILKDSNCISSFSVKGKTMRINRFKG